MWISTIFITSIPNPEQGKTNATNFLGRQSYSFM